VRRRRQATILLVFAGAITFGAWLFVEGIIRFNYPSRIFYPVRGIDVSHHQGDIDWKDIRDQGYVFAFIKATEGANHRDPMFAANWSAAGEAGLVRGAYHFFTFCTSAAVQADNYARTVPVGDTMLPPVVDVEFKGNCARPPGIAIIRTELTLFLNRIQEIFGTRPVIYVTTDSHRRIVAGEFSAYPIWIRNIYSEPDPATYSGWVFWQYADRGRVSGIRGRVDLDVFNGSYDAFGALANTTLDK
jgi:lysozyme